jgi:hypothetical protein
MFSAAGCNFLPDQKSNFALVFTEKAKVDPSLVYGCVARWIRSQDIIVLTTEAGLIQGWNGDKNPVFSVQANGRQTRLYVPKSTIKMQNKLEEMISSCSKNPEGSSPPDRKFLDSLLPNLKPLLYGADFKIMCYFCARGGCVAPSECGL